MGLSSVAPGTRVDTVHCYTEIRIVVAGVARTSLVIVQLCAEAAKV